MRVIAALGTAFFLILLIVCQSTAVANPPSRVLSASAKAVDVELVLAVDVSYSMDIHELRLQREGYAEAIVSKEFLTALTAGRHGAVAITYFEWSSANDQKLIVPWRIVDGPESAHSVATEILKASVRRASQTSISAAINFAMQIFDENPYKGMRRVIDISGDGPNNQGEALVVARNNALAKGVTINGLPIMIGPKTSPTDIEDLDIYYRECVVGGPGAFTVAVRAKEKFKDAIRTKLILEVAQQRPGSSVVPVLQRQLSTPCTAGEHRWRERLRG